MVKIGDKFLVIKNSELNSNTDIPANIIITVISLNSSLPYCYITDLKKSELINKEYFNVRSKFFSLLKLGNLGMLLYA